MALEIERKFLISKIPKDLPTYPCSHIIQGYFLDAKGKNVRIRKKSKKILGKTYTTYYQTKKSGHGLVKKEDEIKIDKDDFEKLWKKVDSSLEKIRYEIPYKNHTIELDVYQGTLTGLHVAEVEFTSKKEAEKFIPLDYFGKELTTIKEASNAHLARYGMKDLSYILTHSEKQNLASFYDTIAEKYYLTRRKHRQTGERIVNYLHSLKKDHLNILELGCGSGRLLTYLHKYLTTPFTYTGVDFSSGLLAFAEKDHPNDTFIHADMVEYIPTTSAESFDVVFSIAAFHHLPTDKERFFVLQHIYKALKYGGHLLMINRAFSGWFFKTYRKNILYSFRKNIFTFGKHDRKNILVPWVHNGKKSPRFYHLFSPEELKTLTQLAGFTHISCSYIDDNGKDVPKRSQAQNSLLTAQKEVFTKNSIENT